MVLPPSKRIKKPATRADRARVQDTEPIGTIGLPTILHNALPLPKFKKWARHRRLGPTWQVVATLDAHREDVDKAKEMGSHPAQSTVVIHLEGNYQVPLEYRSDRVSCVDETEAEFVEDGANLIIRVEGERDDAFRAVAKFHHRSGFPKYRTAPDNQRQDRFGWLALKSRRVIVPRRLYDIVRLVRRKEPEESYQSIDQCLEGVTKPVRFLPGELTVGDEVPYGFAMPWSPTLDLFGSILSQTRLRPGEFRDAEETLLRTQQAVRLDLVLGLIRGAHFESECNARVPLINEQMAELLRLVPANCKTMDPTDCSL